MDPEQIYAEVLQEEQQKGSSPAVAEGRAKAARQRAIEGSPHPKEPKWWPGSQPHFEGGDGAEAPSEEATAEEAPVEAAEAPAAEAAEEQPAAAEEQPAAAEEQPAPAAEEPAAAAPAEAPAPEPAAAPAEQPAAAAAAPAAVATAPPATETVGVRSGMPAGTRVRPEDSVSTEAQFDGQRAMEQRRKLIDELIATGVPAVTAAETGRERSAWTSILFLIIPLLAVLLIVSMSDELGAGGEGGGGGVEENGGGGGAPNALVAENSQFTTDQLTLQGGGQTTIEFENLDTIQHNVALYENADDADAGENAIFTGDLISATSTTYEFDAPPAGEYVFQCDVHPAMRGTATVE